MRWKCEASTRRSSSGGTRPWRVTSSAVGPPPEESWAVLQASLGLRGRLLLTQAEGKTLRGPGQLWVGAVPLVAEDPGRMRKSVFGGWSVAELA